MLAVTGWGCLGQPDHAALAVEVEPIVGKRQRPFSDASVLPRDVTSVELHRGEDGAAESVEVVADQDGRRVVVPRIAREVDLLGADRVATRRQIRERGSRSIVGRDEYPVATDDGRGDVGGPVRDLTGAPQLAPGADVNAHDARAREVDGLGDVSRFLSAPPPTNSLPLPPWSSRWMSRRSS